MFSQQQALQSFLSLSLSLSLEILSSSNMHESSNQSLVIETEQIKWHLMDETETVLGTHLQGDCWSLWGAAEDKHYPHPRVNVSSVVFIAVTRPWWQWQQLSDGGVTHCLLLILTNTPLYL